MLGTNTPSSCQNSPALIGPQVRGHQIIFPRVLKWAPEGETSGKQKANIYYTWSQRNSPTLYVITNKHWARLEDQWKNGFWVGAGARGGSRTWCRAKTLKRATNKFHTGHLSASTLVTSQRCHLLIPIFTILRVRVSAMNLGEEIQNFNAQPPAGQTK